MRRSISKAFFENEPPTYDVVVARLCLLLHKVPAEIRSMSMDEVDSILYTVHCENHKQQEDARIQNEMRNFKG